MSFFLLKKEQIKFKEGQDWKKNKSKSKGSNQASDTWNSEVTPHTSPPSLSQTLSSVLPKQGWQLPDQGQGSFTLTLLLAGSTDVFSWQTQLHLVSAASFVVRNSLQSFRKQEATCKETVEWTHKPPPNTHGAD